MIAGGGIGEDSLAVINAIAGEACQTGHDHTRPGGVRPVAPAELAPPFADFVHDWPDLPNLLAVSELADQPAAGFARHRLNAAGPNMPRARIEGVLA